MSNFITAPGARFPAHDPEIKELFGLDRKAKWPRQGMADRNIQGVAVWVLSLEAAKVLRKPLRARCECPICGKEMAIGRLAQHSKVHDKE